MSSFDIADARVNIAGDIPPLRDAAGAFMLKGEHLDVEIERGTAYFPSGRSVTLNGGNFVIPNTYEKPLIAEMKLDVGGQADAIAELVSYRPILALQRTPFKPEDFSGEMTAQVGARFGLVTAQNPPPPQWQAQMLLDGVTVNKPIAGRAISDIKGTLRIDPQQAVLEAKADIDGGPMDISRRRACRGNQHGQAKARDFRNAQGRRCLPSWPRALPASSTDLCRWIS